MIESLPELLSAFTVVTFIYYYRGWIGTFLEYLLLTIKNLIYVATNFAEFWSKVKLRNTEFLHVVSLFNTEISKRTVNVTQIDGSIIAVKFWYEGKSLCILGHYDPDVKNEQNVYYHSRDGTIHDVTQHPGFSYLMDPSVTSGYYSFGKRTESSPFKFENIPPSYDPETTIVESTTGDTKSGDTKSCDKRIEEPSEERMGSALEQMIQAAGEIEVD